jgi:hypothetical protein
MAGGFRMAWLELIKRRDRASHTPAEKTFTNQALGAAEALSA